MIKTEELEKGCMAKALPEEMTFVLLARDPAAPATIRFWMKERNRLGRNTEPLDEQLAEAEMCALYMDSQRPQIKEALRRKEGKE
ncbi:hypothetical protein KGP36_01870 [Patescibacteria group bacterium]|nr:hypothetical protein [Patescibacteria group bacterium]